MLWEKIRCFVYVISIAEDTDPTYIRMSWVMKPWRNALIWSIGILKVKDVLPSRIINTKNGRVSVNYTGILTHIHKSMLEDKEVKEEFERKLSEWCKSKNAYYNKQMENTKTYDDIKRLKANNVDAVLIGETLMREKDKSKALKMLRGEIWV